MPFSGFSAGAESIRIRKSYVYYQGLQRQKANGIAVVASTFEFEFVLLKF
jgi:hypothetical protein